MKALGYLGLAFVVFGFAQVIGYISVVPCTVPLLGACLDPFNRLENLGLGMAFVIVGVLLLIRGGGRR
jgi:hypothetical protein